MSSKTSEKISMIPLLTDLRNRKAREVVDGIFQGKDMTPQDFFDGLSNVLKNDKVTKEMTDSLFGAFDLNESSSLSKKELAGGLSLACMGNLEDRITFAFEQYVFFFSNFERIRKHTHAHRHRKQIRRRRRHVEHSRTDSVLYLRV